VQHHGRLRDLAQTHVHHHGVQLCLRQIEGLTRISSVRRPTIALEKRSKFVVDVVRFGRTEMALSPWGKLRVACNSHTRLVSNCWDAGGVISDACGDFGTAWNRGPQPIRRVSRWTEIRHSSGSPRCATTAHHGRPQLDRGTGALTGVSCERGRPRPTVHSQDKGVMGLIGIEPFCPPSRRRSATSSSERAKASHLVPSSGE
jgi:hypothetical protein